MGRRAKVASTPPPADGLVLRAYLSEGFPEGVNAFPGQREPEWKMEGRVSVVREVRHAGLPHSPEGAR